MKITYLLAVHFLICTQVCFGQEKLNLMPTKRLGVGDTMPEKYLQYVFSGEGKSLKLSQYKGKLILLDIWGVNCTVCIRDMPKLEAFQQQFGAKIQVVLVTKNSDEAVMRLRNKVKSVENISLPMITNDKIITKLFPFKTIPTHVWIDEKGVVRQITTGWNTTALAIQQHLDGKAVSLPQKKEKMDFDAGVPLWLEGGGRQVKNLQYYSYIMNNVSDRGGGMSSYLRDSITKELVSVKAINLSIGGLYAIAFSGVDRREFLLLSRMINETGDSSINRPANSSIPREVWTEQHTYCYELKVPLRKKDLLFEIMKTDLERFFDINGSIEKRKVKCLVISKKYNKDEIKSSKKEIVSELSPDGRQLVIKGFPLNNLVRLLQVLYWEMPYPILDETGYMGPVDIELNGDLINLSVIEKELNRYGLELTIEERITDMLVLSKNTH